MWIEVVTCRQRSRRNSRRWRRRRKNLAPQLNIHNPTCPQCQKGNKLQYLSLHLSLLFSFCISRSFYLRHHSRFAQIMIWGVRSPAVRRERQQLFEEFVQSNEDWTMSSLNVNSTSRDGQQTRGVYKLMSLEDIYQQLVWVTPSDSMQVSTHNQPSTCCWLGVFDLLHLHACCGVDAKDLMVKYHQNQTVVNDICKNKAGQRIEVPAF